MAHISFILYATFGDVKIVGFGLLFAITDILRHTLSFLVLFINSSLEEWRTFTAWLAVFFGCLVRQYTYIKAFV